jgi:hypothetical protein
VSNEEIKKLEKAGKRNLVLLHLCPYYIKVERAPQYLIRPISAKTLHTLHIVKPILEHMHTQILTLPALRAPYIRKNKVKITV